MTLMSTPTPSRLKLRWGRAMGPAKLATEQATLRVPPPLVSESRHSALCTNIHARATAPGGAARAGSVRAGEAGAIVILSLVSHQIAEPFPLPLAQYLHIGRAVCLPIIMGPALIAQEHKLHKVGQLQASDRDSQSKRWTKSRDLGQPCETHLTIRGARPSCGGS